MKTSPPQLQAIDKGVIDFDFQGAGRAVVELEAAALGKLAHRIDAQFKKACELVLACQGRIVVVGMGKSGHIGGKIASTFASTGTPAFFVHPGEASHGDMGMITASDVVLALSNSGETQEILTILPIVKRMGVQLLSMVGRADSTMAKQADVTLDVSVEQEACPLNLAPTASTTTTLAMGDALAIAVLRARGFSPEEFARSHPGGVLGRRLLLYVDDIMHKGDAVPLVYHDSYLRDALLEMSSKGLGMTGVLDDNRALCGVFTDGDLRRALNNNLSIYEIRIKEIMTTHPRTVSAGILAAELVQIMRTHSINGLFVVDPQHRVLGAVNAHDLLRAGVM